MRGEGRRGGGEGEGRRRRGGGGKGGTVNHHVRLISECMHVICHLEMSDVPIGTVRGIPLQLNTGSSHRTVYLTVVQWGRGFCGHEGGAGGGVTHLLEEEPTPGHQLSHMHSLVSGVVVHSSFVSS